MLHSFFVNSLLEEQLDEEDIKAAVEDRGHCIEQVKIGILAFRTWKDWDRACECGEDIVEEEAKAKEAYIKGLAVWFALPWELPDFEEADADSQDSSEVQYAVLNLKVCICILWCRFATSQPHL